jgi:hypothetical protein
MGHLTRCCRRALIPAVRVLVLSLAACHGAITLEVASDRPVPQGLDTICVGVANHAGGGGQFGREYTLDQRCKS